MSELKAGVIHTPHDEGMTFVTDSDTISVNERETEFYIKSEADKVIADLKSDCTYWKNMAQKNASDNAVMAKQRAEAFKMERHQKYKRCMAMAEMCESMCYWFAARFDHHELVDNVKWELFDRWRLRWAKLSDKFKESK